MARCNTFAWCRREERMLAIHRGFIATAMVAGCVLGCGAERDEDLALDDAIAGEKADSSSAKFTRLERATADEVAAHFGERMGTQLDNCFARYRMEIDNTATEISAAVVDKFSNNYPYDGSPTDSFCSESFD